MNDLDIINPGKELTYPLSWEETKNHVKNVVGKFSKEYSLIKDNIGVKQLLILYTPILNQTQPFANDLLIYINAVNTTPNSTVLTAIATNETLKIKSYAELEQNKKSIIVFTTLLDKSVKGNLTNVKKTQVTVQAVIQILVLIAAIFAIAFGIMGLIK